MSRPDLALAGGESLWRPRLRTRKAVGAAFVGLCVLSVVVGVAMLAALVIDVSLDGAARLFAAPELSISARYSGSALGLIFALVFLFRYLDRRGVRLDGLLQPPGVRAPAAGGTPWRRPLAVAWWFPATIAIRIPRALGRLPWIVLAMLVTTVAGLPVPGPDVPDLVRVADPGPGGDLRAADRDAVHDGHHGGGRVPAGRGRGDLSRGVRPTELVREADPDQHRQPGGVPSIVYGLLGLQLFVRAMELERSVLAGALTMALLVMPIIIVSAQEALRAVPPSMREGAYALGATRWQVVWRSVLPFAFGGTLTGTILALSRAIGETAPILVIGGLTFTAFIPESPTDSFTILPIQIFNWVSRPQEDFQLIAAAGIILLLLVLLLMNSTAIILRQRTRVRW